MNKEDAFRVLELILKFKHSHPDNVVEHADRLIHNLYTYMRYFRVHLPISVGDILTLHQTILQQAYKIYMHHQLEFNHRTPYECEAALSLGSECREIIFQVISAHQSRRSQRVARTQHLIPDYYRDLYTQKYAAQSIGNHNENAGQAETPQEHGSNQDQ